MVLYFLTPRVASIFLKILAVEQHSVTQLAAVLNFFKTSSTVIAAL